MFLVLIMALKSGFSCASSIDSLEAVLPNSKGMERVRVLNSICYESRFSDPAKAMKRGLEALDLAVKNQQSPQLVYIHINLGLLYLDKNQYEKALENFIRAEKVAGKVGDQNGVAMAMQNSGVVYQRQELYEKAKEEFSSAIKIYKETNSKRELASGYTSMGALCYDLKDNEKAIEYFLQSLELMEELKDQLGIAEGYNNIAVIYEDMKNYPMALEYNRKSHQLAVEMGDKRGVATSLYNLALIYKSEKDFLTAIDYLNGSISAAKEVGAYDLLKEDYSSMSEIHYLMADYKNALEFYKMFSGIKDTLFNQDRNKQILEMSTKYQTERKEKENQLLKKENDIQSLSLNRQKIIIASIAIGLFLLVGLTFFIFRGYKQKKLANILLEEKNHEIEEKNKIVVAKNKDITDSIRYAKRLQSSILKPVQTLSHYFNDGFILFRPKDIVSGDFYWFEKVGNISFVAAADCTGHGVPGAFMSIVGHSLLNQAVMEHQIMEPGVILDSVNKGITATLKQTDDEANIRDGMDICLCSVDTVSLKLQYAGAFNSLWIFRKGEFIELKADKFPIGAYVNDGHHHFSNQEIQLQRGDMVYLFTDGFADQFGGSSGKKLKYKQFQAWLQNCYSKSPSQQRAELESSFNSWIGNLEQIDDVLVIGIRI